MADQVHEVNVPGGVLRVEIYATEVSLPGRIAVYLNGDRISEEAARELLSLARERMAG